MNEQPRYDFLLGLSRDLQVEGVARCAPGAGAVVRWVGSGGAVARVVVPVCRWRADWIRRAPLAAGAGVGRCARRPGSPASAPGLERPAHRLRDGLGPGLTVGAGLLLSFVKQPRGRLPSCTVRWLRCSRRARAMSNCTRSTNWRANWRAWITRAEHGVPWYAALWPEPERSAADRAVAALRRGQPAAAARPGREPAGGAARPPDQAAGGQPRARPTCRRGLSTSSRPT